MIGFIINLWSISGWIALIKSCPHCACSDKLPKQVTSTCRTVHKFKVLNPFLLYSKILIYLFLTAHPIVPSGFLLHYRAILSSFDGHHEDFSLQSTVHVGLSDMIDNDIQAFSIQRLIASAIIHHWTIDWVYISYSYLSSSSCITLTYFPLFLTSIYSSYYLSFR